MKHSITLHTISFIALMTTNRITAGSHCIVFQKSLTESGFIFGTRRLCTRSSCNDMVAKLLYQPFRTGPVNNNQRMAFTNKVTTPHRRHRRTRATDPIGVGGMIPAMKTNQLRIASPLSRSNAIPSTALSKTQLYHSSPQRNFLGNNNNKKNNQNDDSTSMFGQVKNIAKKFLPSTWFQSDDERRQLAEQKKLQKEIQTGIQQMFQDAPLPIRMVSNLIGPIFGTMMSSLAETAASQQSMVDIVYDQAVQSIRTDPSVQGLLGDTITVGRPFSQSSSSSSINGVTSTRLELSFPVSGRLGNGVGRLCASGGSGSPIIDNLVVQANGRVVDVNTIGVASLNQHRMKSDAPNNLYGRDTSNIIDAEIIEKDTNK